MISELTAYLASHIPLSSAMQVTVLEANANQVVVEEPLEPNINHRGTIFGGSASALSMLASWGFVWVLLKLKSQTGTIVIRRNSMEFFKPMTSKITAICHKPDVNTLDSFWNGFRNKGKGRLTLATEIWCEGVKCCTFEGEFVVVSADYKK